MTFSQEWDSLYRANKHMSIWPWSDLVSYVHTYAKPADGFEHVLELGCGAGANIPFFLKLGADYFAIEGSSSIVARLHVEYPALKEKIINGDFTQSIPFSGQFDLIVDRSSLTHNATAAIRQSLAMVFDRLRRGGRYIGIDWFSAQHPDAVNGDAIDSHTRTNVKAGSLVGVGTTHFSSREHLMDLFGGAGFHVERLEHKQYDMVIPNNAALGAAWNLVAVRP